MRFAMTTEQSDLRSTVGEFLDERCGPDVVRAGSASPAASALLDGLAGLGATGLLVSEARGGLGLDEDYLVPLLIEAGRSAVPLPLVATTAVAPTVLEADTRLDDVVAGRVRCTADPESSGLVRYAASSQLLVRGGGDGAGDIVIVDLDTADREPVAAVDPAVDLCRVYGGEIVATIDDPDVVRRAWHRGVVGAAAVLIGLARRMLDMTVAYVSERRQFGVPVGSFQAVKHRLASAALGLEFAAPAVAAAGHAVARGAPEASLTVSTAKAMASDAATSMARATLQCHGALAYTTEYDWQLYAKRTWALATAWGSADRHRQAAAGLLGLAAER